jgi:hypothetical protein
VDLLVVQLKAAIRRLLENKGVRARVLDKVNRYGEVVIGVILERPSPPKHAALPDGDTDARDARDTNETRPETPQTRARPSGATRYARAPLPEGKDPVPRDGNE